MLALIRKEIRVFFGSATGMVVTIAFLLMLGLFLWVFPGNFNILESGFAGLDGLFLIAPWVYMFLVPAVTMRSFADEKKSGTLELLFTSPVTDMQVIMAKFLAGLVLVAITMAPTLVYYYSVYTLGSPQGNLDSGAIAGSYAGLLFLASAFVAIGIFASSLTDNQLISFLIAMFLCFLVYQGFDFMAGMEAFRPAEAVLLNLGISEHYNSMSRGVIDTRDVLYFAGLSFIFLRATNTILESRRWS